MRDDCREHTRATPIRLKRLTRHKRLCRRRSKASYKAYKGTAFWGALWTSTAVSVGQRVWAQIIEGRESRLGPFSEGTVNCPLCFFPLRSRAEEVKTSAFFTVHYLEKKNRGFTETWELPVTGGLRENISDVVRTIILVRMCGLHCLTENGLPLPSHINSGLRLEIRILSPFSQSPTSPDILNAH